MFTSQPMRILAVAAALLIAVLAMHTVVQHRSSALPPPAEEELAIPTARVARETTPTIVESNENWLETSRPSDENPPGAGYDEHAMEAPRALESQSLQR
jgi:hypothetical protein